MRANDAVALVFAAGVSSARPPHNRAQHRALPASHRKTPATNRAPIDSSPVKGSLFLQSLPHAPALSVGSARNAFVRHWRHLWRLARKRSSRQRKVTPGHDSPGFGRAGDRGPGRLRRRLLCFSARPAATASAINGVDHSTIGPLWGHRYLASVSPCIRLATVSAYLCRPGHVPRGVRSLTDRPPMPWRAAQSAAAGEAAVALFWRRRFAGSFAGLRRVNTPRSSCHRAPSESIQSHLFYLMRLENLSQPLRPAKAR